MNSISLTLTTKEEKGALDEITDILSDHGVNISYVHLYVKDGDCVFFRFNVSK